MVSDNLKSFINQCVRQDPEDPEARDAFQEQYGMLIYTFPMRIYHRSEQEASAFYLYAFEDGRIFRRMKTFEGRNAIQFKTFLSYYVLRDLFFSWVRSLGQTEEQAPQIVWEAMPSEDPAPEAALIDTEEFMTVINALQQLDTRKRLVLKLFALDMIELDREEIWYIADTTQRTLLKTLAMLEEVRSSLSSKAMEAQEQQEKSQTIFYRIALLQRRLHNLDKDIDQARLQGNSLAMEQLLHDRTEAEHKLVRRYSQQEKSLGKLRKSQIRPAYEDIAGILQVPLGTICVWVARARKEFRHLLDVMNAAHV